MLHSIVRKSLKHPPRHFTLIFLRILLQHKLQDHPELNLSFNSFVSRQQVWKERGSHSYFSIITAACKLPLRFRECYFKQRLAQENCQKIHKGPIEKYQ